jgi:hypothetical protein
MKLLIFAMMATAACGIPAPVTINDQARNSPFFNYYFLQIISRRTTDFVLLVEILNAIPTNDCEIGEFRFIRIRVR